MEPDALPDDLSAVPPKRRSLFGCLGNVLLAALALVLISPLLMSLLGLRLRPLDGSIGQFQSDDAPVPTLQPESREWPFAVTVTAWYWPEELTDVHQDEIFSEEFYRGYTLDGTLAYYLVYDETGFNRAAHHWLQGTLEKHSDYARNVEFDLLPGGVGVQAEFLIANQWKPIGLLYQLDGEACQAKFEGFVVGGQLVYAAPDSLLGDSATEAERVVNTMLADFQFLDSNGAVMSIQQCYVNDNRAEVLFFSDVTE